MCQRRRVVGVKVMRVEAKVVGRGGDCEDGGCAGGVKGDFGF